MNLNFLMRRYKIKRMSTNNSKTVCIVYCELQFQKSLRYISLKEGRIVSINKKLI